MNVTIIGAGPAGLFLSYLLTQRGIAVDLYDQMSGVGKKFLIAGNGGLNLTHSEDIEIFASRYGKDQQYFSELLKDFSPGDLRDWCRELGVETFIGSSGRVFPEKLKAAQILLNWIEVLKKSSLFNLHLKHRLVNLDLSRLEKKCFFKNENDEEVEISTKYLVLALGGSSWRKTGSDGMWKKIFENSKIKLKEFLPMNCGFERQWSEHFISKVDRTPLKNICVKFKNFESRSEIMITPFGLEGSGIYALSNHIRDEIDIKGVADLYIDLKPDLTLDEVIGKLNSGRAKDSKSNILIKNLKLNKKVFTLLKELYPDQNFNNNIELANIIKNCKVPLFRTRPIDEAISTSGGVCFECLDENLQAKDIPNLFFIGEMVDFEAPTGGYLLQGCFSIAYRVFKSLEIASLR